MAKIAKELLAQLTSEQNSGPFVTIMLNTHVAHQDIEKDQLKFKNFAKEAKKRFEKKYPESAWAPFQNKIDTLLADQTFWRSNQKSAAVILSADNIYHYPLSIAVDDQYYVSDQPYLLALIKDAQFNYEYFLLALNRDSMKLYQVKNQRAAQIFLPELAPVDMVTALGDELSGGNLSSAAYGNGGNVAVHGVSTKDAEAEIDWVNYYKAVDDFLKDDFDNPENLPVYLYALPENQTQFKRVAKNPYFSDKVAVSNSPAQAQIADIETGAKRIQTALTDLEIRGYQRLAERKAMDQLVDMIPAAKDGRIGQLFLATSNLIDGFGENPDTEYDKRQILNELAYNTVVTGGEVFVLEQEEAPAQNKLFAVLRY